jgi:hypothetical protein
MERMWHQTHLCCSNWSADVFFFLGAAFGFFAKLDIFFDFLPLVPVAALPLPPLPFMLAGMIPINCVIE